jgi:hypothetical protein
VARYSSVGRMAADQWTPAQCRGSFASGGRL